MMIWLEDMKIRLYPIDGRQNLRDIQNPQWEQTFLKVNHFFYINIYFYFYFFSIYKI